MSEIRQFLEKYHSKPVEFVQDVWDVDPLPFQKNVMEAVAKGDKLISVRSGHGCGKTSCCAFLLWWWISTRLPQKAICSAPTSGQLYDGLFAELKSWYARMPAVMQGWFDVTSDRVVLRGSPAESFIAARTSRKENPDSLQGIHAPHVLLVIDESAVVDDQIFMTAGSSLTSPNSHMVLLGNPTRRTGYFYDSFHKLSEDFTNIHVSSLDSPLVDPAFVRGYELRYGIDSNQYRTRVLGDFPISDDDVLIPSDLVAAAVERDVEANPEADVVWGLDVSRFGGDTSALVKRKANIVLEKTITWNKMDLMSLCGEVVHLYEEEEEKPVSISVDSAGLGAGVADRLRELELPARGINVSEAPSSNRYHNLRAELWDRMKKWFEGRDVRLPDDRRLISEISVPQYAYTSSGKLQIESKDSIKKRGLASPDCADALMLTFQHIGAGKRVSWSQPLRRRVSV